MNSGDRRCVIDASALLAYLQGEPGGGIVGEALVVGGRVTAVNYAEVLSRLSDAGEDADTAHRRLTETGLIGGLIEILSLTRNDAVAVARLRRPTRSRGLSLGDRACLAAAIQLQAPVLTADHAWDLVDLPVNIRQIRA
jgi:ribonuclease VapC